MLPGLLFNDFPLGYLCGYVVLFGFCMFKGLLCCLYLVMYVVFGYVG